MPKENTTPHAALVAALSSMSNVAGNKINPQFRTKYVTLDALLDEVRAVLAKHDLGVSQPVVTDEPEKIGVQTLVFHSSGHVFDFGKLLFKTNGLNAQQISSAVTYGRRISLASAMGIAPDLDDDGKAASASPAKPAPLAIPAADLPAAEAYLIGIGWLKEGQTIADLEQAKAAKIRSDLNAFLAAVRKASAK